MASADDPPAQGDRDPLTNALLVRCPMLGHASVRTVLRLIAGQHEPVERRRGRNTARCCRSVQRSGVRRSGAPELGAGGLSDALASAEPAVRYDAVDRAGRGPDVLEVVLDALVDPDPEVRRAAVRALVRGDGPRATRALIEVSAGDVS